MKKANSFIVELGSIIFSIFSWISIFKYIIIIFPKLKEGTLFVELWVLFNLLLSILLLFIGCDSRIDIFEYIIIFWGAIRVFEIVVYQTNVLLFDEYRKKKKGLEYKIHGYRRLLLLLLLIYFEILFWFASFYNTLSTEFSNKIVSTSSSFQAIKLSFVSMTSFGQSVIKPITTFGEIILFVQSIIGLFLILLLFARFLGLIPHPPTMDPLEK